LLMRAPFHGPMRMSRMIICYVPVRREPLPGRLVDDLLLVYGMAAVAGAKKHELEDREVPVNS